jgi:hypothetical protein
MRYVYRGRQRSLTALIFLLFSGLLGLTAFQWPVENKVVTATFGESRWNHFHTGLDIGGGEQEIRPIDDGELIFIYEEGNTTDFIPTGLGNFLVVEHDKGIRSTYAHLKEGTIDSEVIRVSKDDIIGIVGDSGASLGKHLHFEVSDGEFRRLVNPLLLLPKLSDSTEPVINGIYILVDDEARRLSDGAVVSPGTYMVIIDTYDPSEYVSYFCPMAPYKIDMFSDKNALTAISYEALEEKAGALRLHKSDSNSFSEFYHDDWWISASEVTFNPGNVALEFVVIDFAGNSNSIAMTLTVSE